MASLPELAQFDAGRFIQMGQAGQKTRTLADVGRLYGEGNKSGAAAAALGGGQTELGLHISGLADEDKQRLVSEAASWAYGADSPDKWEQGRATWQQKGYDVGPFQSREALISQALTVKDKMQFALDKQKMAQSGAAANTYGVTPIYGEDAEGRPVVLQIGPQGKGVQTDFPGGVRPYGPQELNQNRSFGTQVGKIDANKPALAAKAQNLLTSLDSQWQVVDQDVNRALESIKSAPWLVTGAGSMTSAVPGSPAYNLSQLLQTIVANIGFDKLQEMRNNSPTGGALGQVSDFENKLLQAVKGSLQQGQSADQLTANLQRVQALLNQLRDDRYKAYQRDFADVQAGSGGSQPSASPMSAPAAQPGAPPAASSGVVDFQTYFGSP